MKKNQAKSYAQVHNDSTGCGACLGGEPENKPQSPKKVLSKNDLEVIEKKKKDAESFKECFENKMKIKATTKEIESIEKQKESLLHENALKDAQKKEDEEKAKEISTKSQYKQEISKQVDEEKKIRQNIKQELRLPDQGFIPSGTKQYQEKMEKIKSKKVPDIIIAPKASIEKEGSLVTNTMEKEAMQEDKRIKKLSERLEKHQMSDDKEEEQAKSPIEISKAPSTSFETKVFAKKTLEDNKTLDAIRKEKEDKKREEALKIDLAMKEKAVNEVFILYRK